MNRFTVPGEPVAQGRPRFSRRGHSVRVYDPDKSRTYKEQVAMIATSARIRFRSSGPLKMKIIIYRQVPRSWSKKKQNDAIAGRIHPTSKPDLDNYAKTIKDALNGIAYNDDAQIVELEIKKRYSNQPRAEITIEEAGDDQEQSKTVDV